MIAGTMSVATGCAWLLWGVAAGLSVLAFVVSQNGIAGLGVICAVAASTLHILHGQEQMREREKLAFLLGRESTAGPAIHSVN